MDRGLSWQELGFRPALFPAAAFAVGSGCFAERSICALLFLFGTGLLVASVFLLKQRTGTHLALLLAFGLAGAGLSTLRARVEVPPGLEEGGETTIEAELEQVDDLFGSRRLLVAVARADGQAARFRARLYGKPDARALFPGQRVRLTARLKPIPPALNPGQPDMRGHLRREGLLFTGGYDPRTLVVLTPPSSGAVWLQRTREPLAQRVRTLAPSNEAAAVYLTLAAGLRAGLGPDLEARFSDSGLAHILSVSGLHVAVLALALVWLLRWVLVRTWRGARRVDVRRIAAPTAVPLVWAYVVFTGNQMPAVRSAVMATTMLLGLSLWRRGDALNLLAVAAVVLLAADPSCVADLSTQLSFLAVLSLVVVAPAIRAAIPVPHPVAESRRRLRYLILRTLDGALGTLCASLAVTLTSAPLIASVFHRFGVAGLVSNVVCLPLCGVLTLCAAGGAFLWVVFPPLADPLLWAGSWGSELLLRAVRFFGALPGASLPVPSWGAVASALFLCGLFGWALFRSRLRHICFALVPAAVAIAFVLPRWMPQPGLSVTFLSVGHGDAIVLSSAGHHAIVDGGGVPGGADTGSKYVLPYLREVGIDRFELAVLSHPHPDHALGLASTLAAIPTRRLWLPAGSDGGPLETLLRSSVARWQTEVELVERGQEPFSLGEATIEVLGPPEDRLLLEAANDRSVVVRVTHGQVSFLLTGDIEEAGEAALLAGLEPVTVVKVPHHGSRTSSSEAFVRALRPRVAVFCVGRDNRFGFPHEEVETRWAEAGARCFRTDLHGAVRVESDGTDVKVIPFLSPEPDEQPLNLARAMPRPHPIADDL
ncbi:MAG: DNA internalization-related competence protein ComEC/Rec2 [Myxococcaceae bacterium]|nr:DNA internalization-related competence protein ComEC/Rec2 [Myxococcaceae bacterium]